jgi:hypothetical protein
MTSSAATWSDVPDTDQRRKRAYARYTDQHGRWWGAVIENKTGDPCGPLEPQFSAPLRPLDKYVTVDGFNRRIIVRYADIILDLDQRQAEWDETLAMWARREYGQKAHEAIRNPTPELLMLVGPKPPPREPWEAAMQGNKWVLGLSPIKPEWANEFFKDAPVKITPKSVEITRHYPDAGEEQDEGAEEFPAWAGPARGWKLSSGEYVERLEDEDKDAYKARAIEAEAALH